MIRYDLICEKGHRFDGWFRGSAAFDEEVAAGRLGCPFCASREVTKALMAPAVSGADKRRVEGGRGADPASGTDGEAAASEAPGERMFTADPKARALREAIGKLREHVTNNAEYVGPRFAEEARKIHYEEDGSRGIYGETTPAEASELREEGIDVHPLPVLPEEQN